jgi:hypothetical protein
MLSSYQVVLWKQESFGVLRPLQIEFFRSLLGENTENPGLVAALWIEKERIFVCNASSD